jgi:hypothetical protein
MQVQECLKLLREVKAIVGQELLAGPRTTDRSRDMSKDSSWQKSSQNSLHTIEFAITGCEM